jgi:hypothetical protein
MTNRPHLVKVVQGCHFLTTAVTENLMLTCVPCFILTKQNRISVMLQDHTGCQQLSSVPPRCSKVSPSLQGSGVTVQALGVRCCSGISGNGFVRVQNCCVLRIYWKTWRCFDNGLQLMCLMYRAQGHGMATKWHVQLTTLSTVSGNTGHAPAALFKVKC